MKKIIAFISIIVILQSCYKDIEIYNSQNFEPQLVVNGFVAADSVIKLTISESRLPKTLDSTIFIDDAVVSVYENENFIEKLTFIPSLSINSYNILPSYVSTFYCDENKTYKIVVEKDDKKAIAHLTFPKKMTDFDANAQTTYFPDTFSLGNGYYNFSGELEVSLTINDPDEKNYYFLSAYYNDYNFYVDSNGYFTDSIINPMQQFAYLYFDDTFSEMTYIEAETPFLTELYSTGILFSDEMFNGQTYKIKFYISPYLKVKNGEYPQIHFILTTLSEDIYNFYISNDKYYYSTDNPFAEPVNIYSNVEGGIGVVGGYNNAEKIITIEF